MKPLVGCYIRVSTDEQAEHGISIQAQKSRLLAYCKAQGWEIYNFFVDDGYSGKDLQRPQIQTLIFEAKKKNFQIVLVLKLDRLSRKQKDVLYLLEDVFEPNQIGFKSVLESFDTTNAFGKASLGMMAVFSQLERETIVERVRLAKKESARQGRFMGGLAPYGYSYNPEKKCLEINEIQAQTVRRIYQQYLEGNRGYSYIAEQLENNKIPGPTNRFWNKQCVRKILTNPVYAGLVKHQENLYTGSHNCIIERDTWDQVQILIQDKGLVRSSAPVHAGLLSGIIFCGECGARMRTKNVWQNYPCKDPKKVIRYYVCYSQDGSSKHMIKDPNCKCGYKNAEDIELQAIKKLHSYSFNQELLNTVINETLSTNLDKATTSNAIKQAKKEYSTMENKINRWYDAFEKGALDPDQLMERIKDLRDKKTYLQQHIFELEDKLKKGEEQQASVKEILELFQDFPLIWEEATPDERRNIVVNLIKGVKVYANDQVELEFNL